MTWLALDIGGAHLKAADGRGWSAIHSFALWKEPARLGEAISALVNTAPPLDNFAVTMTGELADCFETKSDGVTAILDAVETAAKDRPVYVYLTSARLVTTGEAKANPLLAAASNWHALGRYACRFCVAESALLIDIGSTTTDIIPIHKGNLIAQGQTDPERLASGELVYTGVRRSPVCGLVSTVPWRGKPCSVAQELFATTEDVYLTLGDLTEDVECQGTADGRPAIKSAARDRLARMVCADRTMFSDDDAIAMSLAAKQRQLALLGTAARRVAALMPEPPHTIVISGQGEFLARQLIRRMQWSAKIISLAEELGPDVSIASTAHALAVLSMEANLL